MENKKDNRKGGIGKKVRRVFKTKEDSDITVAPKKVSKSASTPDRHHINVLNSKLNDAMEKISSLEWEKEQLKGEISDLSGAIKSLTKNLNYYRSIVSSIQDQYELDIFNKEREIKNMKIQHESDILDKEKIIISQEDKIKRQASSIEEMNIVRDFAENGDEKIPKTKGSLLLDMIIFYENIGRVLNNDSVNDNIFEENEETINQVKLLIKQFENSPDIKADITNQVILSQLKDILKHLENVSDYTKSRNILKEGIELINKEFKGVLANEGVEEIPTVGEKYNPDMHEAIVFENDEDTEDGYIIDEFSKGYVLNGKIIKHAQVKVCKKS